MFKRSEKGNVRFGEAMQRTRVAPNKIRREWPGPFAAPTFEVLIKYIQAELVAIENTKMDLESYLKEMVIACGPVNGS